MSETWRKVGEVGIDTGRIALVDPAYIKLVGDFEARIAEALAGGSGNETDFTGSILTEDGLRIGEVVSTGLGDGIYDVEVREEEVEGWGRRVVELRVRFDSELKNRGLLRAEEE
jgi:hypothetical protein